MLQVQPPYSPGDVSNQGALLAWCIQSTAVWSAGVTDLVLICMSATEAIVNTSVSNFYLTLLCDGCDISLLVCPWR